MRRVLVLSPHFPPTDAVDMHRVRTTVGHYRDNGWEPVVLCVRSGDAGRLIEPRLAETVPGHVRRVEVSALPEKVAGLRGPSAIGLRAWPALNAAGRRLQEDEPFDLTFISTTAFPLMTLGRVWKRRFGTSFVLDFQDPWATFPPGARPYMRGGAKHRLMRLLHRSLERWTVPHADGLLAVSQTYIDLLRAAYPPLQAKPALASPFGYSEADFEISARYGRAPWPEGQGSQTVCYFAGRIAPAMEASVTAFFQAVRAGRERNPGLFGGLKIRFVGTGYQARGNPPVAARLAAQCGVEDLVEEHPDRVSLFDALKGMLDANVLLIFGSDDAGYIPSKLNQCLSLAKPIICAAPQGSPLLKAVAGLDGVFPVITGQGAPREGAEDLISTLAGALAVPTDFSARILQAQQFEAAACARRECELFDEVVARRGRAQGQA